MLNLKRNHENANFRTLILFYPSSFWKETEKNGLLQLNSKKTQTIRFLNLKKWAEENGKNNLSLTLIVRNKPILKRVELRAHCLAQSMSSIRGQIYY